MYFLLVAAAGLSLAELLYAGPIQFQSRVTRTALLELYTSEGCSSCPPAEAWLSRQKDVPGLWKDFVPVAFHVDYWDYLGWRDPWASKSFSDRQREYAQIWKSETIYTPEFFLNGREWRNWSSGRGVPRLEVKPGVLALTSTNGTHWWVSFAPAESKGHYEIHVALLSSRLVSKVQAGENRGRRLEHDFVVLSLVEKLLKKQGDEFRDECILNPESQTQGSRLALGAWVTAAGQQTPLQATGGWLPAANR